MLSENLRRVCELQPAYSSENTPAMQERGRIIRTELRDDLMRLAPQLRERLGRFGDDFSVDASDGIGRKTEAPWIRFCSASLSPSPRDGYYAVLHFAADGTGMFVTVGCGSTVLNGGELKPLSDIELEQRTSWARDIVIDRFETLSPFDDQIALGARAALPRTFEKATVLAKRLSVDAIDDAVVEDLLLRAAERLGAIYAAQSAETGLTQADQIRAFLLKTYIEPARGRGETSLTLRSGTVQEAMGLREAWTNICSVLSGAKLQALAGVRLLRTAGPPASTTTTFTFDLEPKRARGGSTPGDRMPTPTNLILYGPPGTGKTYASAAEAVRLCDNLSPADPLLQPQQRPALMARYNELREAKRIEFVTFHQSYGYEEFVEGLRPVQEASAEGEMRAGFSLQPTPGIFKTICRRAEASKGPTPRAIELGGRRVFKMSIGEAANPDDDYLFEEALESGRILLGWGDSIDWSDARFASRQAMIDAWRPHNPPDRRLTASSGYIQYPFTLRNRVRERDLIVVSKGNRYFRAIGEVVGPYEYQPRDDGYANQRKVRWLWSDRRGVPVEEIYAQNFVMGSLYELRQEDLNQAALARYLTSGAQVADSAPEPFVLIIDEINRANISKVFGELITLIEPSKRLDAPSRPNPEALSVQLPFSNEIFGVPANLHIVGTMNTADRSIALLDTALRRRFRFRELLPEPALLGTVDGIDVAKVLANLNERIEYLFDRDHQIGHAFFLKAHTREALDEVMRDEVIPLLAEYFHEDWERIWVVLDEPEASDDGAFLARRKLTLRHGLDDGHDRYRYVVKAEFAPDAFERLGR